VGLSGLVGKPAGRNDNNRESVMSDSKFKTLEALKKRVDLIGFRPRLKLRLGQFGTFRFDLTTSFVKPKKYKF